MPHTFTKEIEIRETNYHQEPEVKEGDRYIDDSGRYCEVNHVRFIKYVYEDISQWEITITVYNRNELTQSEASHWEKQKNR